MSNIKYINIKEFRESGYLQEINRRFLHPLGLALEVIINEDGTEKLGGIWDYRTNPEGIIYDLENSPKERIDSFKKNREKVNNELEIKTENRIKKFGFCIEPIV